MKRFELNVKETVEYNHTIVIEMNDDADIDDACDYAEKAYELSNVSEKLEEQGCKVISVSEDTSGDYSKFEIDTAEPIVD